MRGAGGTGGPDAVLAVRGLRKRWAGASVPVLDGVDLDVAAGETLAVVGANGAGKTTLLRIVAGLLAADAGRVEVCGRSLTRERTAYQSALGLLSAGNSGLYARLKVEHHLELAARLGLLPRAARHAALARALDEFALRDLCGRRVDRLSMGQRQRLRVAMTFAHEPRLVLLDEPVTSLDAEGVAIVGRALTALKSRGGSALVCRPSGSPTVPGADRTCTLAGGRLAPA